MMPAKTQKPNGVDVARLAETVEAVKATPKLANIFDGHLRHFLAILCGKPPDPSTRE